MNPTRKAFASRPREPIVPARFREALHHVVDDAMPEEFAGKLGEWLHEHRASLAPVGDAAGKVEFGYALANVDSRSDLFASLRKRIANAVGDEDVLEACCVAPFELDGIDMHAMLRHHGGHQSWDTDAIGTDGQPAVSRRLVWAYYVHSDPRMFSGGEREFVDGTTVEPKHNRLHFWHPAQRSRVRQVECWSAHVLHGQWSIVGTVTGEAPQGWAKRLASLLKT